METSALVAISELLITGEDLRLLGVDRRDLFGLQMPGVEMFISVLDSELRVLFDGRIVSTVLMVDRVEPSILLRMKFLLPQSQIIPCIL
jgi:hypothetical protein